MNRLFLITLLILAFTCTHTNAINPRQESLEGIIIIDIGTAKIIVNDYMNALSVTVEVLDDKDNVEYATTAGAGDTVSFPLTSRTKKVRSSYYLGVDSGFVISTEVINL